MKVKNDYLTVGALRKFIKRLPDDAAVNLDFAEEFISEIPEVYFAKPGDSPYKKGCLVIKGRDMNL